jgi:hypothetical protein
MDMDETTKREYLKEVISHLESLKSQMLLFSTFEIGLIALTLTNIIFSEILNKISLFEKYVLAGSIISVFVSSGLFAIWASLIQVLRTHAIDWLVTQDVDEARRIHYPGDSFLKRWGWIFLLAIMFMIIGISGYLIFILFLIFGK